MQGKACLSEFWSSLAVYWCNINVIYSTNLQEVSVGVGRLAGEDEACRRENKAILR